MPKEIVVGREYGDGERMPFTQVTWGRDNSSVQIATRPQNDDDIEGRGWYASLERHDINRLIRILRKARDQAFGADA